jgi:5-methylcytosine-specific restriction protein A
MACNFDFKQRYGERGSNFIEVHHLKPVSSLDEATLVDPKTEMAVVCSNCHRMIHREKDNVLSLDELREIIRQKSKRPRQIE